MRLARVQFLLLVILALLAGAILLSVWQATNRTLTVTFLDVGQGDSIIIKSPAGRAILIDGGEEGQYGGRPGTAGRIIIPALLLAGIRRLDAVVLTHPHDDHFGGLAGVIENIPTGILLLRRDQGAAESQLFQRLLDVAERRQVQVVQATAGQVLNLGRGVRCEILHPGPQPVIGTHSDVNNNSIVMRLTYRQVSFLLPGDLEAEGEQWLFSRRRNLASTVLKVAHHGSDSATSEGLLGAVRPRLAVISVGRWNRFGCPHPVTLARLRARDARILRTDLDGAIAIRSDGQTCQVRTYGHR
jgi:competence protein ComEC